MVYVPLVLYASIVSPDISNVIDSFKAQDSYRAAPVCASSTPLSMTTSPAIRNDYTTQDAINYLLSARKECDLPPHELAAFERCRQPIPRRIHDEATFNRSGRRHT